MYIIESIASIPTKLHTVINTTKYYSPVVQTRKQQIQDCKRPPF